MPPAKRNQPDASASPDPEARTVTLADLSDEDRRALLAEAREASRRNPTDVEGYEDLSPRERSIRNLMDARDHARGCPVAEGTELGRVEGYDARRPPDPVSGAPEAWLAVLRCVNCGGATVLDERLDEALEQANESAGDGGETTL